MSLRTWFSRIVHGESTTALGAGGMSANDTNGTEMSSHGHSTFAADTALATSRVPVTGSDKDELARRFRQWLDERPEEPVEGTDSIGGEVDLYAVFAELIALKNEVRHESRQFKGAFEDYQKALALVENSSRLAQSELETRREGERHIRAQVTRALLLEILEVRDRLVAGADALARLKPRMLRRKYRAQRRLVKSLYDGQRMIVERIDKLLHSHGAAPIAATGRPFDPHTMRAIHVVHESNHGHGEVMAEIRSGHLFHDEVLRPAEVVVNKLVEPAATT